MDIGDVLGKPFKYIWKNSILWALGMVTQIVPTVQMFLLYYFWISNFKTFQSFSQNAELYAQRPELLRRLFGDLIPAQIIPAILTAIGIAVVAGLISFLITEFVTCCIIRGIKTADSSGERISIKEIIKESWKPYGQLILQDIFWGVAFVLLITGLGFALGAIGAGVTNGSNEAAGIIVILCCTCGLIVPVGLFLSLLFPQIRVSLVHDNLGVFQAIRKGWSTLFKAFGWMLLLGLILGAATYFIRWLSGVFLSIPLNFSTMMGSANENASLQTTQLIILAIFILVEFFINSYVFTYLISLWTMAYRRINYPPTPPLMPEDSTQKVDRDSSQPPTLPS